MGAHSTPDAHDRVRDKIADALDRVGLVNVVLSAGARDNLADAVLAALTPDDLAELLGAERLTQQRSHGPLGEPLKFRRYQRWMTPWFPVEDG